MIDIPGTLLEGYLTFRSGRYADETERYRQLSAGQAPEVMVIGCADSRVDPATVFNARPGELFVVRNVAAIVPPYERGNGYHGTSAAIEFAVKGLKVSHIVVMGHGNCGGVAASLHAKHRPVGEFIEPWVGLLNHVRDELLEHASSHDEAFLQHALELMAVKQSIDNLTTFSFVEHALRSKSLTLHGAWFSIAEGTLHWLDQDTGEFKTVASDNVYSVLD